MIKFSVLIISLVLTSSASASASLQFSQNWSRYPSADAFINTLATQFPFAKISSLPTECQQLTPESSVTLGQTSPITGEPTIKDPNSSFLVWYMSCVRSYIVMNEQGFDEKLRLTPSDDLLGSYFGAAPLNACPRAVNVSLEVSLRRCVWKDLSDAQRLAIIQEQVEILVGPEIVLTDLGLASSMTEFTSRIDKEIRESLARHPDAYAFIGVSGAFTFTVRDAVKVIRFLVLLNDTLKY